MVQHVDIDHTGVTGVGAAAHIADAADAHDASAISFAPAGTISATDVQAAIEEVASEAGGSGITTAENKLGADVTMSVSNTFYDGPSLALTAGTYLLTGAVLIYSGGAVDFVAKLWNGTAVESSGGVTIGTNGFSNTVHLSGVVTLAGDETWKISVAPNAGSANNKIKAATVLNGAGNNASYLHALKIA